MNPRNVISDILRFHVGGVYRGFGVSLSRYGRNRNDEIGLVMDERNL